MAVRLHFSMPQLLLSEGVTPEGAAWDSEAPRPNDGQDRTGDLVKGRLAAQPASTAPTHARHVMNHQAVTPGAPHSPARPLSPAPGLGTTRKPRPGRGGAEPPQRGGGRRPL